MLETEKYDILMELGSSIKEIYFSDIPNISLLEALADYEIPSKAKRSPISEKIIFHLPLDKVAGFIDEYEDSNISSNIYSANFQTDQFIDWQALYALPNLRKLVLTCEKIDSIYNYEDISNIQLILSELEHFELLVFDMGETQRKIIEQIESFVHFPFQNIKVEFKSMRKRSKD
ncbi:hypothetical protein [Candidatus Venteria ishoeyi]|uniref:Uncharacterized protein n=1 Tax=Candidatus Venteria ishoeyi TaxID=1899563 RepID=A0A1H6F6K8_9GAMM|nr:hypothetical protein [Candidatus Venteria ishoeyi]SEH04726.1 Uncharacterised protein [Candidatus Venteria ishoeyi]